VSGDRESERRLCASLFRTGVRNARGEADSGGPTTNRPNHPAVVARMACVSLSLVVSTQGRCEDVVVVVVVVVFAREEPHHVVDVAL